MRALLEMVAAFALKRLLGGSRRPVPSAAGAEGRSRGRRGPGRAPAPAARPAVAEGRPRGPLVPVVLGALGVGAVTMLLFEAWYTRVIGVLALFTFVVAGVFLITGSGLLDPEEEQE
jgi:hypothetical protein